MTTRARELLNRSRALLGGSREAAAQLLAPPPTRSTPARSVRTQPPAGSRVPGVRAAATPSPAEEALSAICADLALRDLNLVDTLLAQLEEMESREEDADRLAELYRLDHLAARLRRNAENLRVLAGRDAGEQGSQTSSLVDVIRGAMSSIDHYQRVTVGRVVNLGVVGFAAEDVSRLLAELLDNATKSSPPHSPVRVGAHLTETGSALLRIEDEGIGLPAERLRQINQRLTADPVLDDDAVRHMGLAVVRRLATRHGIKVWLDHRHPHGTTGSVLLPAPLVCELPDAGWSGLQTVSVPAGADGPRQSGDVEDRMVSAALNGNGSRPAAGTRGAGRLPARRAEPAPASPPPAAASAGTTASGLPRRVSHSLRDTYGDAIGARTAARAGTGAPEGAAEAVDPTVGHKQLLADLGAFSEGERAARDERRAD
ncbi:sensor histidine kinase [Pseudofrankia inefficax]|uniref:histidine kinase n=1 Tax=Pseudofrankia inefficax (strain DSM 45817 / CECT 9037 / DDB 130130 / EuI1c) TaxID=298654 RepID=E3ITS1_PSEI1|nr:ATP-binding protein [Pseudofrankia inefficax]ADP79968.1 histidine kinase [Pseudofrankia inefficax]